MKTIITATFAALLLAGTASAALAQERGGHRGEPRGGDREGGQSWSGRDRAQVQADQPTAPPPAAREAPAAPAAIQAPEPRPRAQFRGDGGQGLANGRGREAAPSVAQPDVARERGGRRGDGDRRWDGNPGNNTGGDANRDGRRDGDRRAGDRNRADRNWDRRDGDRGRPHWQQGRYPPVYRSHQRYRYGHYRPPIGFYAHSWTFGEYLPRGWYGRDYLLDEWWSYDLLYPPPGYDWVRVGGDALLIDEYTGRVVQVVRDIFW